MLIKSAFLRIQRKIDTFLNISVDRNVLAKKPDEVCVLSALLWARALHCPAARLFLADSPRSVNEQPGRVFSKCLPKAKNSQERVLQVKAPKSGSLQVQIGRQAQRGVMPEQLFVQIKIYTYFAESSINGVNLELCLNRNQPTLILDY